MMSELFGNLFLFWIAVACTILLTWNRSSAAGNDDSKTVEYRTHEELAVPHHLGNVKKDSGLHDPSHPQKHRNTTNKSPIRFHFKSSQMLSSHLNLFRLDETSGDLFLVQRMDRDSMCPASHVLSHKTNHRSVECTLTFDVVVKPLQYFKIIKVTIVIIDINDNSPRFLKKRFKLEIVESSPIGSLFLLPTAEDDDEGVFDVQEFQLLSRFNEFELKMAEHADGSVDARLKLISKLDRELRDHYEVTLIAIDGGRPPRSGSTVIDIVVLDSNDNPPVFERSFYQATVSEDSQVGLSILTVMATDKDIGTNADITYVISDDQNLFGIEQLTGRFYLKHSLDYEQAKQHRVTVSAFNEDSAEYSLTAMTTIVILVDDVNDNAPQITINLLTTSQQAEVLENAATGLFVAHATVKDADSGSGGDVTCSLGDQSNFRLESLFSNEFKITTGQIFDREVCDNYQVTMSCQDHGNPSLTSNKTLSISILDDNDNTPTFHQQLQILSLPEDTPVGSQVIAMSATDEDSGRNGAITYSLEEVTRDDTNVTEAQIRADKMMKFSINHLSGQITVDSPLDFETKTKFKFLVRGVDSGDPQRTGTCILVVNVVDVNDNAPRFDQVDGYTFNTPENCTENSFLGKVRATDEDSSAQFRLIKYSLRDGSGTFSVDPSTGDVLTAVRVDREQRDVYRFTVMAENVASLDDRAAGSDLNFKKLRSSTEVTVFVTDVNDNSPTFVYPNMSFQSIEIYRNVASYVGSPVVRCHATDPDEGPNAALRYEIVYGNEDNKFSIDPVTGMIFVAKTLIESSELTADDEEILASKKENKRTVFHLVLKASDSGTPSQSAVADLVIFINDTILPNHSLHASAGLSLSSTFVISVIGSLVGGVLVLCCLAWGMFVFCKMSNKPGRLRNPQIGGIFHDEKCEKESTDVIDLCPSKPELGLSVKSLNSWQNKTKFNSECRSLRSSMPNLQRNQSVHETTFICRCSTGLRGKLDADDEIEKQVKEENQVHSSGDFHAPVPSLGQYEHPFNCCNLRQDALPSLHHGILSNPRRSHRSHRTDADSDSTCSDSGRGLSEDERSKQARKKSKHDSHSYMETALDQPLLSSMIPVRHKPQVSFRLSPPRQHQQQHQQQLQQQQQHHQQLHQQLQQQLQQQQHYSQNLNTPTKTAPQLFSTTLPLLKAKHSETNCTKRDAHIWPRTLAGVTSEI